MDFRFSAEDETYRREVRSWLEANVPSWGHGRSRGSLLDDAEFERHRDWQRRLYEAGYVGTAWPVEYGGSGRTAVENAILQEEMVRAGAPPPVNALGIGLCGPALLHYGSDEQKARYLRSMLTAEEIWC